MSEDRPIKREITTAELNAAAERAKAQREHDASREVETAEAREREVQVSGRQAAPADVASTDTGTPLLSTDVAERLRSRWTDVQAGFVDEPRKAVEEADALVAEAIRQLAQSFSGARASLERDWSRGEDASTEDLRKTLQRYRAFFGRLLQI
jgi:hypothetical protein